MECPCCDTKVGEVRIDPEDYWPRPCPYCKTMVGEIRQIELLAGTEFRAELVECAAFVAPVHDWHDENDWVPGGEPTSMYGVYAFEHNVKGGGSFRLKATYEIREDAFDRAQKLNKEWWKGFLRRELFRFRGELNLHDR